MKHILILIAIFLINSSAQSQEQYTRTLVDAKTGELIPFAKVLIKGNDKGIIGGADGTFIIFGLPTDSLIISATHYSEFRILVGTEKTATIQLNALVQDFSELVVTALGVKRDKRDLGFSVQTISEKDLTEVRNPNLINSMAGRIAGVQTTNGSSGVGSSSRIIIRGETSLSGTNQPLFVIDGVPVSNEFVANNTENLENDFQEVDYGNGIGDIGADDIQSITVLKGPSAAALYGSRAANGVVVIETKEGKKTKGIGVSINSSVTIDQIAFLPEFQNTYGQGAGGVFSYEDGIGGGIGDGGLVSFGPQMNGQLINQFDGVSYDINGNQVRGGDVIARAGNPIEASAWNRNPDNIKSFFQTGVTSTQNIAFSSAGDKGSYRFSYTRMDNTGTLPNTDYTRNNVSMTSNYALHPRVKLRTSVNYINTSSNNRPGVGYGSENVMYSFLWTGR